MKLHRVLTGIGLVSLIVAATGCGKSAQQGQPQMPPPDVGVVTAQATSVPLRAGSGRPPVGGAQRRRARAHRGCPAETRVHRRQRRQGRPGPVQDRSGALAGRAECTTGEPRRGAGDLDEQPGRRRARALGRCQGPHFQSGRRHRRRRRAHCGRRGQAGTGERRLGEDQSRLCERDCADLRSRGPAAGHRRRIGRSGRRDLLTTIDQIDLAVRQFQPGDRRRSTPCAVPQPAATCNCSSQNKAKIDLLLPDGSAYAHSGTLDFSDTAVDAATGAVTLRGIVPNPQHALLPGMYVNVRVTLGDLKHAWLVSQLAVQRDGSGAYVFVVGSDGKVVQKRDQGRYLARRQLDRDRRPRRWRPDHRLGRAEGETGCAGEGVAVAAGRRPQNDAQESAAAAH